MYIKPTHFWAGCPETLVFDHVSRTTILASATIIRNIHALDWRFRSVGEMGEKSNIFGRRRVSLACTTYIRASSDIVTDSILRSIRRD
jgi:hypothetical protein